MTKRKQAAELPQPSLDPEAPQLRTSERTTFKRCLWQWDRNYNDRLRPIREAPALRFGTLIHKAPGAALPDRHQARAETG